MGGAGLALLVAAIAFGALTSAGRIAAVAALATAGLAMITTARVFERERRRLVERERQALSLAELDGLTGLGNYRLFRRALLAEGARTARHGEPFSLIVLDLDGFKAINDELGHQAGDRALKRVGEALRREVRAEDVICRHGGDEFGVIAVGANFPVAGRLAGRLVEAVARTPTGTIPARRVTASAGWASFAGDVDDLVARADAALIDAKRQRCIEAGGAPVARRTSSPAALGRREPAVISPGSAEALTVLGNLARALAGARSERTVCEIATAHLAGAIDAGVTAAVRQDDDDTALTVYAAGGQRAAEAWSRRPASERAALRAALRDGRATVCLEGAGSEMAVPVDVNGRRWGALMLESEPPHVYGQPECALAGGFARQTGRAVAFVRMLDHLSNGHDGVHHHAAEFFGEDCLEVARLAATVGRSLGLAETELQRAYLGGLFHGVGTIRVPEEVLRKPGRLSDREFALVREHPIAGESVLRSLPALSPAAATVRHNHERFDGGGYPDGLSGEAIPLPSRILFACDALVAMTSPRPYRSALSNDSAEAELKRGAGVQFDTGVVDALLGVMSRRNGAPHG